jgi:hypothetical protein
VASPDKSVSVVAVIGPDQRFVAAHLAAAGRAFEVLEQQALAKGRARELLPTKRRQQILDALARQSGSSAAAHPQRVPLLTRRAKIREVDLAALRAA